MYSLHFIDNNTGKIECLDENEHPEPLVYDCLRHWHEDSDLFRLFFIKKDETVWCTITSGENPHTVTVCRTDGAAQWLSVRYLLDDDGKYLSTEVKSISRNRELV